MVTRICGQLTAELNTLPKTQAHAEVANLMTQVQELIPEVTDRHNNLMSLLETTQQEIKEKISRVQDKLNQGRAIRDGQIPREEVEKMQVERFGNQLAPPPLPAMPDGWSSVLAEELLASAVPETPAPILPTESNAWNDWRLGSNV